MTLNSASNRDGSAWPPSASAIEAVFSHGEDFDYIDLRLAFDGIVFSSFPSSSKRYDGPWEDASCEHVDFLVYFSSVFCAFGAFVKFLEAIAIGVEECSFGWDPEGPDASFSWRRVSHDGTGFLSVIWRSKTSFRYVVRIDGKRAVRALYGAFREFVESESYDPIRYERMSMGETLSHLLEKVDFERLPVELAKLDAASANALLDIANGWAHQRSIKGPKRTYPLSLFFEELSEKASSGKESQEGFSTPEWIPANWDEWPPERRLQEIGAIMESGDDAWRGANLREMRSTLLEAWLKDERA